MSVYNGFSTRAQETKYGQLCEMLVGLLSTRILKMLKGEKPDNTQFTKQLTSIYTKMLKMESIKYLPPKLSISCNELAEYCMSSFEISRSSSSALSENEVPPSPKIGKVFSPISGHPLEQIDEEVFRPSKKKFVLYQEKAPKPPKSSMGSSEISPNSYYEKVMEKYIKLSNKYAPRSDRSLSVGSRDTELLYKDGIFFKS